MLLTISVHDVSSFTSEEMEATLDHLMETLDEEGRNNYLSILDNFDYIPTEEFKEMITSWPPKIHLLQTVRKCIQCLMKKPDLLLLISFLYSI